MSQYRSRRTSRRLSPGRRPRLECLEDRTLPSFIAALNSPAGVFPRGLVTGDFNGDGKPDVATLDATNGRLLVLLGKGDGSFAAPITGPTTPGSENLVAADFNHDGKLDLVTSAIGGGTVSVLLGNGDG